MSLQNLPPEQLASMLEDRFKMTAVNERIAAAEMLRRQHEAIKVLRMALGRIAVHQDKDTWLHDECSQALADTEEMQ